MKEAVQEGAVLKEKIAEIFIYGKNAVPVRNTDQFKRHTGSALHGIFVSAGRTGGTLQPCTFCASRVRKRFSTGWSFFC